jgi:hypothetical protein
MNKTLASTILFFLLVFTFSKNSLSQKRGEQPKVNSEQSTKTTKELSETFEETLQKANKERLSGLNSIYIWAIVGSDILKTNGLTDERIKTDVEIKLRQAGFKFDTKTTADLWIVVKAFESKLQPGLLVYSIKINLTQEASLDRKPSVKVSASIWERSTFGTVGSTQTNLLRETIKDFVDEFILDYLKANESVTKNTSIPKAESDSRVTTNTADLFERPSPLKTETDSPFRATYVGGNAPPEVEIFNDSDRTMYVDLGQGKLTAYTILSKQSISLKLVNGNYNYKASAARVSPLKGINEFKTGYRYTWRFTILKR